MSAERSAFVNGVGTPDRKWTMLLGLGLVVATLVVYWPVRQHAFINYDDPDYVTGNLYVQGGVTWAGIVWAVTRVAGEHTYWHPLTWLSHMLDCELFGLNAGAHHLVNVFFHVANVVLLFGLLRRLTGAAWRSAIVAALFALHPLQVETVAWIAERKNLLSTLFFLLTLWAYARYAQNPESRIQDREGRRQKSEGINSQSSTPNRQRFNDSTIQRFNAWYLLALFFFALGLMSKPTLVMLPCVMLLLDFWPLQRVRLSPRNRPSAVLLRLVREKIPFFLFSLTVGVITILAHRQLKLVMTLEQMPMDARAANALVSYARYLGKLFWPDSLAVFYPYPGSWPPAYVLWAAGLMASISLAVVLAAKSRPCLVVGWLWFLAALLPVIGLVQAGIQAMANRFAYVPLIGWALVLSWGLAGMARPRRLSGWMTAGALLLVLGLCAWRARAELEYWRNSSLLFARAVAVTKDNYIAHENLAIALAENGSVALARTHLQEALRIKPDKDSVHFNLGLLCALEGKPAEAVAHYRKALVLRPANTKALNNLAWLLATHPDAKYRDGAEAVRLATRAVELTKRNDAEALDTLAAAYAEAGRFEEAASTAQQALGLARSSVQTNLAAQIQSRLRLYQSRQAYREP
jgi:tetratricopeptide (TPR) repeat protein